jgi:hypothetical protein
VLLYASAQNSKRTVPVVIRHTEKKHRDDSRNCCKIALHLIKPLVGLESHHQLDLPYVFFSLLPLLKKKYIIKLYTRYWLLFFISHI